MKDFDFVKLTLWLTVVLIATAGGGYIWYGYKLDALQNDLKIVNSTCSKVGACSRDIKNLEQEKANDKLPTFDNTNGISTYFYEQAKLAGIDANTDYTYKPREPETKRDKGYVDRKYSIDLKNDRLKLRKNLITFIYNVETQSRRIKLAVAKLTLEKAQPDLWKANLVFVQRDPVHGESH